MVTRKLILTDVDNTLLDYGNMFQSWLEGRGYKLPGHVNDVYYVKHLLPLTIEEELQLFHDFSHDPMFGNLPPLKGAQEALRSLVSDGWEFIAVTACHEGDDVQRARQRNLEDVFQIDWPVIHYTGLRSSKFDCLSGYEPAIWVEDSVSHAIEGSTAGHHTFLIDHPYNRHDSNLQRVSSWSEIAQMIA